MLVAQGYATFAIGKWHLTPEDECPRGRAAHRWPLGRGFERFYGFMAARPISSSRRLIDDNHHDRPAPDAPKRDTT